MTVALDLPDPTDLLSPSSTSADGNAAVLTAGAVIAVAVGRVLIALLLALVKAVLTAAAVGVVLWLGYQVLQASDYAVASLAPVVAPADVPTLGPLAPR